MRLELTKRLADEAAFSKPLSLRDRLLEALDEAPGPLNVHDLRHRIGGSNDSLRAALKLMLEDGLILKEDAGYLLI